MAVDDAALRKLDEVARRVAMYRKAWHAARPEQANQAYERYRAEEEYLARLMDDLLGRRCEAWQAHSTTSETSASGPPQS